MLKMIEALPDSGEYGPTGMAALGLVMENRARIGNRSFSDSERYRKRLDDAYKSPPP